MLCQVNLFLKRLIANFDNTPAPLRKGMSFKEGLYLHQCCGGFVHFLKEFEKLAPPDEFTQAAESLRNQFGFGYLDPDIYHCLETQVSPGLVRSVSAFRPAWDTIEPPFWFRASFGLNLGV